METVTAIHKEAADTVNATSMPAESSSDNIDYRPIYSIVMRDMRKKFRAKNVETVTAIHKEAADTVNATSMPAESSSDNIDYRPIYSIVMRDMRKKFRAKKLTKAQKREARKVIKETQEILRNESLKVLGIERGNKSESQILSILTRYKSANNNTNKQKLLIKIHNKDTQIRMIQRLTEILELTYTDLGITNEELNIIKDRETFKTIKIPNEIIKTPTTQDLDYKSVTISTPMKIPEATIKSSVLIPRLFTIIAEMNNLHIQREVPDYKTVNPISQNITKNSQIKSQESQIVSILGIIKNTKMNEEVTDHTINSPTEKGTTSTTTTTSTIASPWDGSTKKRFADADFVVRLPSTQSPITPKSHDEVAMQMVLPVCVLVFMGGVLSNSLLIHGMRKVGKNISSHCDSY